MKFLKAILLDLVSKGHIMMEHGTHACTEHAFQTLSMLLEEEQVTNELASKVMLFMNRIQRGSWILMSFESFESMFSPHAKSLIRCWVEAMVLKEEKEKE